MSTYVNKDVYYCYSINLFHFLKLNGFFYIYKEKHHETGKFYWVFEKTESFRDALDEYSALRNSK